MARKRRLRRPKLASNHEKYAILAEAPGTSSIRLLDANKCTDETTNQHKDKDKDKDEDEAEAKDKDEEKDFHKDKDLFRKQKGK